MVSAALQHHSAGARVGLLVNAADVAALAPAEAALLAAAAGLADAGELALSICQCQMLH